MRNSGTTRGLGLEQRTVCDQLGRELRNRRIQIVLYHVHDCSSLRALSGIAVDWVRTHRVLGRLEPAAHTCVRLHSLTARLRLEAPPPQQQEGNAYSTLSLRQYTTSSQQ